MRSFLLALATSSAALMAGCNTDLPYTVDITIPLGSGFTLPNSSDLPPGTILPPNFMAPEIQLCSLPTTKDLDQYVRNTAGGLVASLVSIDRLELLSIETNATTGDFGWLRRIGVFFRPAVADDTDLIDMGTAAYSTGLGESFTIKPPQTIDVLDLLTDQVTPGQCAGVTFSLSGTVPILMPVWDMTMRVRVYGTLGG
jgi:hypothetical protein